MANDSFKVKKSLNIKPIDPAEVSNPQAGDIIVDSTANNALKAYNANAGVFEEVSSGNGGLSVFDTLNFESAQLGDFATGNNAAFLGGGSLAGTAAFETVAPLSKLKSFKFTQAVGSAADYVAFGVVDLEKKVQGQLVGVKGIFTYDGNNNEIDFIVYDVTNGAVLGSAPIRKSTDALTHEVVCNIPSNCTQIRYGIQVAVENDGTVLLVDDIEASVNPLASTEIFASSKRKLLDNSLIINFGSIITGEVYYWREGSHLAMEGKFTVVSSGASRAEIQLPDGLQSSPDMVSGIAHVGVYFRNSNTTTNGGSMLVEPSSSFVGFSASAVFSNAARDALVYSNVNDIAAVGQEVSVNLKVPIAGWSNTKQGVVVKNVESTDIANTNEFSATILGNGSVEKENLSGWIKSVSNPSAGTYDITFADGLFSTPPIVHPISIGRSGVGTYVWANTVPTTSGIRILTSNNGYGPAGTLGNIAFGIQAIRQGTDYIKESERVYTVPVDTLTGNSISLSGNDGRTITAATESIPFNGSGVGWTSGVDGSTPTTGNYYTVQQNNSIIKIVASYYYTTGFGTAVDIFKNGVFYKRIGEAATNSVHFGSYVSGRGEFAAGDKIAFVDQTGGTLQSSSADTYHYLNITEEYGDRGIFLGNMPTNKYQKKVLSASLTSSTTDISDLRFNNLEIGKTYKLTVKATMQADGNEANLSLFGIHNGVEVSYNVINGGTAGDVRNSTTSVNFFTAEATTVTFNFQVVTGLYPFLDANNNRTYVILEELNTHRETTDFS